MSTDSTGTSPGIGGVDLEAVTQRVRDLLDVLVTQAGESSFGSREVALVDPRLYGERAQAHAAETSVRVTAQVMTLTACQ